MWALNTCGEPTEIELTTRVLTGCVTVCYRPFAGEPCCWLVDAQAPTGVIDNVNCTSGYISGKRPAPTPGPGPTPGPAPAPVVPSLPNGEYAAVLRTMTGLLAAHLRGMTREVMPSSKGGLGPCCGGGGGDPEGTCGCNYPSKHIP